MRVLLDTHVLLGLMRKSLQGQYPALANRLSDPTTIGLVSVASFWEIAIKTRLGKLDPGMPLKMLAGYVEALGLEILAIEAGHVIGAVEPEPATRDPFDRLLLAQCAVDDLKLATIDRALREHPLAFNA